jgi:chorismate mutase/prephenate dehydratase
MNGPSDSAWEQVQERRNEIDRLDNELLRLISRRARLSADLADIKKAWNLPLYDGRRELQIVERMCAQNPGPMGPGNITNIFRCIIEEARRAGQKPNPPIAGEIPPRTKEKDHGHQYGG